MVHKLFRRSLLLSVLTCAAWGVAAQPASYPSRAVRMVVAFAPGGPIDLASRIVAEGLSERLGQPFIVENRTGANGAIAAELVRNSQADGYTMLVSNASMITITPMLKKDLKYNVERDFTPVTRIAASPLILVVNPDNPQTKDVRTVADLVAVAKRAPGQLSYGSAGLNGNVQQLAFELFAGQAGVSLLNVPYKGSSEAQAALLSKTVALGFDTLTAIQHIKAGKLVPLAVSSRERLPDLPDVPTMQELGYPNFDITFWSGVFLPKGTPPEVVTKLSKAFLEIGKDPAAVRRLQPLGSVVISTPEAFGEHIRKETAILADVIRRAGIKAD